MSGWEAYNCFGKIVRTFGSKDQAEAYRDRMAAIGADITLKRAVTQRRAA